LPEQAAGVLLKLSEIQGGNVGYLYFKKRRIVVSALAFKVMPDFVMMSGFLL
jgi:hypothetical protein